MPTRPPFASTTGMRRIDCDRRQHGEFDRPCGGPSRAAEAERMGRRERRLVGSAAVDIIILIVVVLAGVLGSLHKESLLRGIIRRVDFIMFSHV